MLSIANFKVAIINMFGELMENISVLIGNLSGEIEMIKQQMKIPELK